MLSRRAGAAVPLGIRNWQTACLVPPVAAYISRSEHDTYTLHPAPCPLNRSSSLAHGQVRRCKYCVSERDSLLYVMKGISPDLNWLRLWAANGNDDNDPRTSPVDDPDMLALDEQQQLVNVGPVYRTAPGDTLMMVAARFRTTVKSLLLLNPDVQQAANLLVHQELCLIPCAA